MSLLYESAGSVILNMLHPYPSLYPGLLFQLTFSNQQEGGQWKSQIKYITRNVHVSLLFTWPAVLFNWNPLSLLNLLDESSSHFCLPYEKCASVSFWDENLCLQRSQWFDGFVCLNPDSSTNQESQHEIYTMCTLLSHGNNSGLQKDQTASVMNVNCRNYKNDTYV